jgi:Domain of unknown function (DUF5615)/Phage integrase family
VRLVADENRDFSLVTDLRAAGYDVVAISEQMAGADDQTVIDFARSERRLLLTEDKDFGQLVFAAAKQHSGVILGSRLSKEFTSHDLRRTVATRLAEALGDEGDKLVKRVLGHSDGSVTAIYNRYGYVREMRKALERWAIDLAAGASDEKPAASLGITVKPDVPTPTGAGAPKLHHEGSALHG